MSESTTCDGKQLALSFGSAADDYVRGRPSYPIEAIDVVGIPSAAEVVDLAAGTGKLTEALATRFSRVVAVEPDESMRAANRWGDVRAGTAEAIPLADESVDAVFVAEAFHWFCEPPALREIERVLRPRGALVLLWNRPRGSIEGLVGVHELMERLRAEVGVTMLKHRFYSGEFKHVFEGSAFGPLQEAAFDHDQLLDKSELVSYFMSQSTSASRTPEERTEIRAELERLIPDGRHVRPLTTEVYWTRLR